MHKRILLNGRFLTRPMTGVDRVAQELTSALLNNPRFAQSYKLQTLLPRESISSRSMQTNKLLQIAKTLHAPFGGHAWEQLRLSTHAATAPLLSLCNTGPILRRNQIVIMHDAQVHRFPQSYGRAFRFGYQTLQPLLGQVASTVLTVSHYSKQELEHFGVVPEGKAIVLPNGADHILRTTPDLSVLTHHNLQPGGYFLSVGTKAKHKNLRTLCRAMALRKANPLPLVIVGTEKNDDWPDAHNFTDIRPIGRVSDAALRALYENAAGLLFPSFTEGFGLPAAEAMVCGCPVVATTKGAVPEVCGQAALLRDPDDVHGWAEAMDQLETNPELRAHLKTAGLRQIAPFTWASAADRLVTIIEAHQAQAIGENPLGAV